MDNTKLILSLDAITKQLQKISATIGISVGISDKGGKPKVKTTLDTSEKFRTKAIAKETAEEYKKILGLGFKKSDSENNAKILDDKLKITSFFRNTDSVFKKISKSVDNLVTVTTNTSTKSINGLTLSNQILSTIASKIKDYTSNFTLLEKKINDLGSGKKDYTSLFSKLQTSLDSILSNTKRDYTANLKAVETPLSKLSSNLPKDYTNSFKDLQASLKKVTNTDKIDYSPNLKQIQSKLSIISNNVPKDYTQNFKEIGSSLLKLSNVPKKDYTQNFKEIKSSLLKLSNVPKKDYTELFKQIKSSLLLISENSPKDYTQNFKEIGSSLLKLSNIPKKDYDQNFKEIVNSLLKLSNIPKKDYDQNFKEISSLLLLISENSPKDYTENFKEIVSLLSKLSVDIPKDYTENFKQIGNTLSSISDNTQKDYDTNFKELQNKLSIISSNSPKDYFPDLKEIQSTLLTISTNVPKDYTPNLQAMQSSLNTIASNVPKDYTPNLQVIQSSLNTIASNVPKDYTPNLQAMQSSLNSISKNTPKDYTPNLQAIQSTLLTISTNVPKDYTPNLQAMQSSLNSISKNTPKDYTPNLQKITGSLSTIAKNAPKDYTRNYKSIESSLSSIASNTPKDYTSNFQDIQSSLSIISSNTPKDYTTNLQAVESSLSSIASNVPKDYTVNFQAMQSSLSTIASNVPKDYAANFQTVENSLSSIASNTSKDYEPYFDSVKNSLLTISTNVPKDYEPIYTETNSKLESIKTGISDLVGSIPKAKDLAKGWDLLLRRMKWESFRTIVTDYFVRSEASASELNQKLSDLVQVNTDILNKKSKSTESGMSFGKIAGLTGLGVGLVLIINALVKSNMIDTGNLLKVLAVVGAIVGMFIFVGKVGGGIKDAGIGFGILSATILFLIIPMIMRLTEIDSETLIKGLLKLGGVFATCLGVLYLMGKIKSSEVMQNTKGFGLFALIVGFLMIPLIKHITTIPFEQLLEGLGKLALVFGACLLAMKGAEKIKGGDVLKSMAGVAALSLILKYLVIPMLISVSGLDWKVLLKGLANVALAIIGMGVVAYVIGQLSKAGGLNMLMGAATILALSFVVGYLGDSLTKVADKNWGEIYKGLGLATLAIAAFGLAVAGIGALVANPVAPILLGVGAITIIGLSFVAGYLATSLAKFAGHNWNEITNGITGSVQAMWVFGKTVAKMGVLSTLAAPFMVAGGAVLMKLAHVSGLLAANLQQFAGRPWNEIVPGLQGASEGMWSFSKTVAGMGAIVKIFGESIMDSGSAVLHDLSILAGVLANNLMEFANKPWDSIVSGLESSTVAMAKFGVFVAGVGVFSKLMDMGIDVVYKISDLIGNIAENLFKYSGLDQINFQQIGSGLVFLGEGLKAMFTGSLSNIGSSMLDSISGFFKSDPVSKIKKFETIDSRKIYELGLGLKYMGEGLRSLTTDLNLTNLIRDITVMTKPVIDLAYGVSQFSDAYKKFQAVQMETDLNQIKNINVQNDNGIKDAINESSKLQLDIMRDQLVELKRNNQLMEILVANGANSGSSPFQNAGMMMPLASNQSKESYTSPSFSTKDHYRDNLKLLSMSFQG